MDKGKADALSFVFSIHLGPIILGKNLRVLLNPRGQRTALIEQQVKENN